MGIIIERMFDCEYIRFKKRQSEFSKYNKKILGKII